MCDDGWAQVPIVFTRKTLLHSTSRHESHNGTQLRIMTTSHLCMEDVHVRVMASVIKGRAISLLIFATTDDGIDIALQRLMIVL